MDLPRKLNHVIKIWTPKHPTTLMNKYKLCASLNSNSTPYFAMCLSLLQDHLIIDIFTTLVHYILYTFYWVVKRKNKEKKPLAHKQSFGQLSVEKTV